MRTAVVTLSANEGIVLPLTDVVVFGANGRTGRIIVEKLLDRRHNVTAAMRNPAAFSDFRDDARHPQRLRTASVDVEDPASVLASVDGQTASTGAPRFLCVSSGGANRYDPNLGFWFRRIVIPLAGSPEALPASARDFYIELLRRTPGALRASFDYYRAIDVSIPQYRRRVARGKLTMPVLAFSGALACESMVENELRTLADDVFSVIIPDCGIIPRRKSRRRCWRRLTHSSPPTPDNPGAAGAPNSTRGLAAIPEDPWPRQETFDVRQHRSLSSFGRYQKPRDTITHHSYYPEDVQIGP